MRSSLLPLFAILASCSTVSSVRFAPPSLGEGAVITVAAPIVGHTWTMHFVLGRLWARSPARRPDRGSYDRQGRWWNTGTRFTQALRLPMEVRLTPFEPLSPDESAKLPVFIDGVVPLMRVDLIRSLESAGVTNLDLYPAALIDPDSGERHSNYWAFNLIGLMSAVNRAASTPAAHEPAPAFENVRFDSSLPEGLLCFRLAEKPSAILVHQSVRDRLLSDGFDELEFFDPQNFRF